MNSRAGAPDPLPSNPNRPLHGQPVVDDVRTNEQRLLPYENLCNPVFRLKILEECCIFMVDTGSTCNLAFKALIDKFPFTQLLPTDSVVQGVGGLAATLLGKFDMSISIGNQTITCPFLLSDYPINNLDGLIGISTLKQFHSWSLGGSPEAGAYLEINQTSLKLSGFGIRDNSQIAVTLFEPEEGTRSPQRLGICLSSLHRTTRLTFDCPGQCQGPTNVFTFWGNDTSTPTPTYEPISQRDTNTASPAHLPTNCLEPGNFQENRHSLPESLHTIDEEALPTMDQHFQTTPVPRDPRPSETAPPQARLQTRRHGAHYSSLFLNSQWEPRLECKDDVHDLNPRLHKGYATGPGELQPHSQVWVSIQVEGRVNHNPHTFIPFFTPDQPGVVRMKTINPSMARLLLVNGTNNYLTWEHGQFLGTLEEVEELLMPTFACTGDVSYGKDDTEWYSGRQEDDIFNSLISVNQQTNFYDAGDGTFLAGPAPDPVRIGQVNLCRPHMEADNPEPIIVAGDFRDSYRFGHQDIIAHQVNSTTVTSHGLSKTLENSYPYGSIYRRKITKSNILAENELRALGSCMLRGDENPDHPTIANLVGQFFYGKPTDQGGCQESYMNKFADKCNPEMCRKLKEDNRTNRLTWFQEALVNLQSQLKTRHEEEGQGIMRVFFPYLIGCAGAQGPHEEYMEAVRAFTKEALKLGIIVYLVVHPEENRTKYGGQYPTIQPARPQNHQHVAGRYHDAPNSFCKDPMCKGCPNNRKILELLRDRLGEEAGEGQSITQILDGMSPDTNIPLAASEEERQSMFEELLKEARIGDLEPEQLEIVKGLLRDHSELFITSSQEPAGRIRGLEVDIPTEGPPIACKKRRFSPKALEIMEELNDIMLQKGLTRPCDGPWSSPVVLVKKKPLTGQDPDQEAKSYRFCVDYRAINEKSIVWKAYPVADMKSQLQRAAGFRYYSTLDINAAFHCVAIRPASQPVTAFSLPSGLYCFTRLPFGLSISPQIWAKAADTMLHPVKERCSYYADDIVCHSHTFNEHLNDLKSVLATLTKSGVKVQLEKCVFFMKEVVWLRHKLSHEGISPDPKGVSTVHRLGTPKSVSELRSVIGTLNYFKDFIEGYADMMAPLSSLLKKTRQFLWGEEQEGALRSLKQALTSDKILVKPNFDQDFYLQCDASDRAVSAILSQRDPEGHLRPIQYWSKKLTRAEGNYSASEKEALAVFLAFQKFEPYLLLNTTHVYTDASVLKAFYGSREVPSKRILRWALFVGQFHHTVTHVRGQDNDLPDLISRCVQYPSDQICSLVAATGAPTTPHPIRSDILVKFQGTEEPWKGILSFYQTGEWEEPMTKLESIKEDYRLSDQGILCVKDKDRFGRFLRVIVPSKLIPLILYWNHDPMSVSHQGFDRTLRRVKQNYFWPTMVKDTELYVRSCLQCQLYKEAIPYLRCRYHPSKMVPETPGEILCLDIAYLPRSAEGFTAVLVIVDLFSRLVGACPLRDMTANEITKAITTHCCIHGFPTTIYSDRAGAFKKALQEDCYHLLQIKHDTSVPWRHCSNISERYIRMVKDGLKLILPTGKFGWWARYIKFVTYAINTSYCKSIDMSPFEAYYARKPNNHPSQGDIQLPPRYQPQTEDWLQPLREAIKNKSCDMKEKYLAYANGRDNRPEGVLKLGDIVVIQRHDFPAGFPDKLMPRREGPLKVTAIRGFQTDLEFLDGRGLRTRHLSEIAPFYTRTQYLEPLDVDLDSGSAPHKRDGEAVQAPRRAPGIVYGRLEKMMEEHLAVVSLDAISREPTSDTIKELILGVTHYNPYGATARFDKKREWEIHYARTPRPLASVTFSKSRTRAGPLTICSLVTQAYQGPPIPDRSIADYQALPEDHLKMLEQDTRESRLTWMKQAFADLASILAEGETYRPRSGQVLLEGEMFLDTKGPTYCGQEQPSASRVQIVEEFTWLLETMDLSTTVVWREERHKWSNLNQTAAELPFRDVDPALWPLPESRDVEHGKEGI